MSIRLTRTAFAVSLLCALTFAGPAAAQVNPPVGNPVFAFPGHFPTPPSAASAGLAMADRWLGDEPFGNPAAPGRWTWTLSPLLLHENRQDLSAANREFNQATANFDIAGASFAAPLPGASTLWLYLERPESRSEDVAFIQGRGTDPSALSAQVASTTEVRETRVGGALGRGFGAWRAGVALEWVQRRDAYDYSVVSGSPQSGTRTTDFDGDGVGFQAGVRYDHGDSGARHVTIGASLRMLPALSVSGTHHEALLTGTTDAVVEAERASGWEGGVSGAFALSREFRLLAAFGGRTSQEWSGLGVTSGTWASGSLAGDYHDPETPWMLHFGVAIDQQSQVPEERAGTVGLSFGYDIGGAVLEIGGMHRSISRSDQPRAYQDRVVLTLRSPH